MGYPPLVLRSRVFAVIPAFHGGTCIIAPSSVLSFLIIILYLIHCLGAEFAQVISLLVHVGMIRRLSVCAVCVH